MNGMTAEPSQPPAAQESDEEPRTFGAKFWLERARRVLQNAEEEK